VGRGDPVDAPLLLEQASLGTDVVTGVTTAGKSGSSAALDETPLENMSGTTMNHVSGSSTRSGPMSSARSSWVAV
jgi:hypothetical protein